MAPVIIPEPEEAFEAFQEGLIDYELYQALLEMSRSSHPEKSDSPYFITLSELLTGFSVNPSFITPVDTITVTKIKLTDRERNRGGSLLFRQYHRLRGDIDNQQLTRLRGEYGEFVVYGEYENEYSGNHKWGRRYLTYSTSLLNSDLELTLGGFSETFGLGLIYGYHGQLLSKVDVSGKWEHFLFPRYGGSNGIRGLIENDKNEYLFLYDVDRNIEFEKQLIGASIVRKESLRLNFSVAHGMLKRSDGGISSRATLFSIGGDPSFGRNRFNYELAMAVKEDEFYPAGAATLRARKDGVSVYLEGWSYHASYPSWFSGGPSSRRYRTLIVDELELSYRDRFSGETGGVGKTTFAVSDNLQLSTLTGYYWRAVNDNRVESRLGVKNEFGRGYSVKFDIYWRNDESIIENKEQRRTQLELNRKSGNFFARSVIGHRYERYNKRDDYMVFFECRVQEKYGQLRLTCKIDRLHLQKLSNDYSYLSIAHDTAINKNLTSYIKYTFRYRRGEPESSYGVIRWDLNYRI